MKKLLVRALLGLVVLALGLVVLANWLAEPHTPPPFEPDRLVALPDGSEQPLELVVARSRQAAEPLRLPDGEPLPRGFVQAPVEADAPAAGEIVVHRVYRSDQWDPDERDLFELAGYSLHVGRLDDALALYHLVPPEHPRYADAQRHIGWRLYSKERGQPGRGLAYVNRSLAADVLNPEVWQDAYRVYLGTLGLPMELPRW